MCVGSIEVGAQELLRPLVVSSRSRSDMPQLAVMARSVGMTPRRSLPEPLRRNRRVRRIERKKPVAFHFTA